MYLYPERIKEFLKNRGWTAQRFADELGVELYEVEKMLNGEYIGVDTGRKLIMFFRIPLVLAYIDFERTGVKNPFAQ